MLLLFAAIVFLSIVIPSVLSLARQVFNPSLVKSSWNSLNLVLVIFAIVCGFLGRKDNDDQTPGNSPMRRDQAVKSTDLTPRQWYEYQDNSFGNVDSVRRLRRNSSSYPDLRLEGSSMVNENRWRFYDDTHVCNYQFVRSESRISRSRSMGVVDEDEIDVKCIEVDNTCASSANDITPLTTPKKIADVKNIEMDTVQIDHKSEPAPVSPPAYLNQPLSPPLSPSYFCPSPSPPPPPPPPPPRKNRDAKRNNNPTKRASTSPPVYSKQPLSPPSPVSPTYFWPSPSPPPPPPPPPPPLQKKRNNSTNRESRSQQASFPQQPLSPSSPLSQINYLWPPPSPPPPPPPPPPPAPLRTYSSILSKKKHENKNSPPKRESRSQVQIKMPPPPPPPPPPRTPPRLRTKVGQSSEDKRDKKGGGIVIRTLGRLPRRKRKQTRRSYENLSEFIEPPKVSIHRSKSTPEFPPSSPPKPIPAQPLSPPPHSIFQNLFSKKGKSKKKVHTLSHSAPPAPPPPPDSRVNQNRGNGSESPLIPIPPPPPPPSFKMPPWRYVMQGDYVRLESNNNSPRSGYSPSEDEDSSPNNQKPSTKSSLFCPSPDVNTKADDFIARFRAKLILEKLNSSKQNQGTGPSPLGPDSTRS